MITPRLENVRDQKTQYNTSTTVSPPSADTISQALTSIVTIQCVIQCYDTVLNYTVIRHIHDDGPQIPTVLYVRLEPPTEFIVFII